MLSYTHDLEDYMDMETMQFVNPYDINPIVDTIDTALQTASIPQQVSVNPDFIIPPKDVITQDKLKMEEFSDLSALLSATVPNVDITGSTDELSTPVFDKEAFDFTPHPPTNNESKTGLKVKVECNAHYYSCGKNMYTDLTIANDNQVQSKGNYSISEVDTESINMYLYQPPNVHTLLYKENTNDTYSPTSRNMNILDKISAFNGGVSFNSNLSIYNNVKVSNSTATSPQDDRYSNISSPADDQNMEISTVPDHYDHSYDTKPKLNLMTEQFKLPIKQEGSSTLNTPDVIDDVVNMGQDFNILDMVNNADISIISADEDLFLSLNSPSAFSSEPSTPSTTLSKPSSPVKKSRRRKLSDDDDDEDYIPPSKKSTVRLADLDIESGNSSDESYYETEKSSKKSNSKPRGRPPKRGESVSSDGSKDQDVSKYRELRDKNNEASRRSRLKRKVKEQECEKEAEELRVKNIRLKARVEGLEKMVSTFRNNILKIIGSK